MAVWNITQLTAIGLARLDAEHFHPAYVAAEEIVRRTDHLPLGTLSPYIRRGLQPEYDNEGDIPVLRSVNIRDGWISGTRQQFVTRQFYAANQRCRVQPGDVLINSTGVGTLGRIARFETNVPHVADGHITIVRDLSIDPLFVSLFLLTQTGRALVLRRQRGSSGQVELYPDDLRTIPIPIPTADLCERLNALWDRRSVASEQARSCHEAAEVLIKDVLNLSDPAPVPATHFIASSREAEAAGRLDAEHFIPAYRGIRDSLMHRFKGQRLEEVGVIVKGITPTNYVEDGIPVIRSGDLVDLEDSDGFLRAAPDTVRFFLAPGDVLVSSIGLGSIGRVDVFDHAGLHTTVSEVTVIRSHQLNPYFLRAFLRSPLGQVQIESWVTGATGQLHLRPADVAKIVVPMSVPDEIQKEFEQLRSNALALQREADGLLRDALELIETYLQSV